MSAKHYLAWSIKRVSGDTLQPCPDRLALEEPLEIQVGHGPETARQWKTVAITMRTPGHDRELAAGFLVGEGIIRSLDQVEAVFTRGPRHGEQGWQHSVRVAVRPAPQWRVEARTICALPARLREAQEIFEQTGGLHAAGLFTPEGGLIRVREDVGRHNAVDKVVGAEFLAGRGPLPEAVLVVSGRASFELMQKALASGIPMLVAVGAPSSLAVEVAEKFGATLIGFTKPNGFNIYTGAERVRLGAEKSIVLEKGATVLPVS